MDKKLAILLPGLTRTWEKTYKCFFDFIEASFDGWRKDLYISTWDITGLVIESRKPVNIDWLDESKLSSEKIEEIRKIYSPIKFQIENHKQWKDLNLDEAQKFCDKHDHNNFPVFLMLNSFFAQFYKNKKCFDLIDDPDEYDLILKYRFDAVSNPVQCSFDPLKITFCDTWGADTVGGRQIYPAYKDLMAIGSPRVMRVFCDMYDFFRNSEPGTFNRAYKNRYVPEQILCHLMMINNIEVNVERTTNTRLIRK